MAMTTLEKLEKRFTIKFQVYREMKFEHSHEKMVAVYQDSSIKKIGCFKGKKINLSIL